MSKPTIAIMYDFDKTLCTTDMQEYDFIKNLGMTPADFWGECNKLTEKNEMDKILAYMYVMIKMCKDKHIPLTREYLNNCGKNVVLYKGVSTWFNRIQNYADKIGVNVEHYIISSGITEIIEGTSIAKHFKHIYGCKFIYNEFGDALWPGLAINFTLKTQFIFRIAKGVLDVRDDENLNNHTNNKKIPFENMIYIGDGLTDVPCMKLLKDKGGKSIALYPSLNKRKQAIKLVEDERINYVCVADYSQNSTLEKIVKLMMDSILTLHEIKEKEQKQIQAFKKAREA